MGVNLGESGTMIKTFDANRVFMLLNTFKNRMVMTACIFSKDEGMDPFDSIGKVFKALTFGFLKLFWSIRMVQWRRVNIYI